MKTTYRDLLLWISINTNLDKKPIGKKLYKNTKARLRSRENAVLSDYQGYPYFVYTFLYNKGLLKKEVSK